MMLKDQDPLVEVNDFKVKAEEVKKYTPIVKGYDIL